jgi:hypothetical protein
VTDWDANHLPHHKFFEQSPKDHPRDKTESATKGKLPLRRFGNSVNGSSIPSEGPSGHYITNTMASLDEDRQLADVDDIGTLFQRLDNNLERLSTRATGPLQKDSGKARDLWNGQERYNKANQ